MQAACDTSIVCIYHTRYVLYNPLKQLKIQHTPLSFFLFFFNNVSCEYNKFGVDTPLCKLRDTGCNLPPLGRLFGICCLDCSLEYRYLSLVTAAAQFLRSDSHETRKTHTPRATAQHTPVSRIATAHTASAHTFQSSSPSSIMARHPSGLMAFTDLMPNGMLQKTKKQNITINKSARKRKKAPIKRRQAGAFGRYRWKLMMGFEVAPPSSVPHLFPLRTRPRGRPKSTVQLTWDLYHTKMQTFPA